MSQSVPRYQLSALIRSPRPTIQIILRPDSPLKGRPLKPCVASNYSLIIFVLQGTWLNPWYEGQSGRSTFHEKSRSADMALVPSHFNPPLCRFYTT